MKIVVQAGPCTVLIRDDRAVMDKKTLKAWKAAAHELIEGAVINLASLALEEAIDDGE